MTELKLRMSYSPMVDWQAIQSEELGAILVSVESTRFGYDIWYTVPVPTPGAKDTFTVTSGSKDA